MRNIYKEKLVNNKEEISTIKLSSVNEEEKSEEEKVEVEGLNNLAENLERKIDTEN